MSLLARLRSGLRGGGRREPATGGPVHSITNETTASFPGGWRHLISCRCGGLIEGEAAETMALARKAARKSWRSHAEVA